MCAPLVCTSDGLKSSGVARFAGAVRGFVEQRLAAAAAEGGDEDGALGAALANYGAFVEYAEQSLG